MCKCKFSDGSVDIRIGDTSIDPCRYKLTEIHKNVTVEILECPVCGHVSIGWKRQDNTEDIILEENE